MQVRSFTDEESLFILNEISLSKWDFRYWCERYCTIAGSDGDLTRFSLRPSQEKLLKRMSDLEDKTIQHPHDLGKVAIIVAKARRVGATVLAEAAVAHSVMLRRQAKGLVASCEPTNSLELFKILTRIYDNLPLWMRPRMSGRVKAEHLYFEPPLDSDITIGHGRQQNPMGQGVRLDIVHLTEMSSWLEIGTQQVNADMLPAFRSSQVPSSLFFIESTGEAKSADADTSFFESQYKLAKANRGDFRSCFISWYDCPEMHTADPTGVEFKETTLSAATRIKTETGYECTKEQLAFYQMAREQAEESGELSVFLAEYPSSDEDCFAFAMECAWPIEVIDSVKNDLPKISAIFEVNTRTGKLVNPVSGANWEGDPENKVLIWEKAKPGYTYVVGVDAAYGIGGADSSAIFVNRVGNRFSKDKQVCEFWSNTITPDELAKVCWAIGHLYTDKETGQPALMAIESNPGSPGLGTQTELNKMGYTNFYTWRVENSTTGGWTTRMGWYTTGTTRPLLTKKGVEVIQKKELQISSPYFISEMKSFVNYGWKRRVGVDGFEYFAHAQGRHDDRIFAGFIAYYVSHDYDRQNLADERRRYWEQKLSMEEGLKGRPRQYQDTDMSWEDAVNDFEERLQF